MTKVENIKQRLYSLAANMGISVRAFEEKCGLGRGNISNIQEGGSIGSDKLTKIIDTFPDVDIKWLLTGEEMERRPAANQEIPQNTLSLFNQIGPYITAKDNIIIQQAEEIGRLKAKIEQLEAATQTQPSAPLREYPHLYNAAEISPHHLADNPGPDVAAEPEGFA